MQSRARLRLEKEHQKILTNYPEMQVLIPDDDDLKWLVSFKGPENSLYSNENFT